LSFNRPIQLGRRHFLAGAGGFLLAIPFLSSLEKPARAGGASGRPRFFYLGTDHGGCFDSNFFPSTPTPNSSTFTSGHTVSSGPLSATTNGSGVPTVSPVLTGAALSSKLVGKMNVLRGLDVPWYIAHNTGQHLGDFARNDGAGQGGDAGGVAALGHRPTIDQFMANSPEFYTPADLGGTTLKSMIINPGRALSWAFSDPSKGTASPVQNVQGVDSSLALFNSIFGGLMSTKPMRPPVVDKVLANYNSLRQGNTRLSAADKMRLDAHINMLAELQMSLNATVSCTVPATPTDDAQNYQNWSSKADTTKWAQLFMDVVAAAFQCGASRIGVLGWGETASYSDYPGMDWHHEVAHLWFMDPAQGWLLQSYQAVFEQAFLYLAAKLDGMDDGGGKSVLDNSLLVWSQESGMETHTSTGVQVVTFGGAAGWLNTGLYCDYRNHASSSISFWDDAMGEVAGAPKGYTLDQSLQSFVTYPGLLYEQWLATAAQAMSVKPSEFELWKDASNNVEHGIGTPYLMSLDTWYEQQLVQHYQSLSSPYFQKASEPLPFLQKA
jgi:hypothetical protein